MILQALARYYDILRRDPQGSLPPFGYSAVGVSYALQLSQGGELQSVLPLYEQVQRGKRVVERPRTMFVPAQVKRSVNVAPNFLWDNPVYVLGISARDDSNPEYSRKRFEAFRKLHREILENVDSVPARGVVAFLDRHDPRMARSHPAIVEHLDEMLKRRGNLVFLIGGEFAHDDPAIREAWQAYIEGKDAALMQCLVTGKMEPIARLHPGLKRIRGAQSTGASLVSFNERAYESYNRTNGQGLNAPVGQKATFAYATALNYLLSDANPNPRILLGDTTVVYWAETENPAFARTFASLIDPSYAVDEADLEHEARRKAEAALAVVARTIGRGRLVDLDALLEALGPENPRFYVLGLAPNAARAAVRLFVTDPFAKMVDNLMAHYRDLRIVKEFPEQPDFLSVRQLLAETVSRKARDGNASPLLAGATMRAILTNSPYPAALYYAMLNRIQADMDDTQRGIRKINYARAATIKAFLLRKYRHRPRHPFQEVLTMTLNRESTIPAYVLGRLFAVLERVQRDAIGEVGASVKDRYFTSACASPGRVFPLLLRLSQHHISKAEYGYDSDRRIQELLDLLDVEKDPFPAHLTLDEQGIFVLGYYHQRADFYRKRESAPEEAEASEIA